VLRRSPLCSSQNLRFFITFFRSLLAPLWPLRECLGHSLERGSEYSPVGGIAKSGECAVVDVGRSPLFFTMNTNTFATRSENSQPYVRLQREIHDALRAQHPEWVNPNGDCPTCESYESRLAQLLDIFASNERKSAA
jgi:hypothetical protein